MQSAKAQLGKKAEVLACHYLTQQGLRLLRTNYPCYYGEIDIIMQDRDDIVFIEVRYRRHLAYGSAIESISPVKQKKLIKAALYFLCREQQRRSRALEQNYRFDVIGIQLIEGQTQIEWIKNAFSDE